MDLEENVEVQLDYESHKSRSIELDTCRKEYDQQYPPASIICTTESDACYDMTACLTEL